jgi:hypothetical protein
MNPELPFDRWALGLGFAAPVLLFWASGALRSQGFLSLVVDVPLAIGLVCFVLLLLVEFHAEEPLAPVKMMWTTLPIVGTLVAMIGGGAFVTLAELTTQYLTEVVHQPPLAAGLSFWPQIVGTIISAALLGAVFRTRYLPLLVFGGMAVLILGGLLLVLLPPGATGSQLLAAVGLLGLGAGATVSPALFLAGLPLPSKSLGRIFALIELVRSVADFILAPVVLQVARVFSHDPEVTNAGLQSAMWITIILTVVLVLLCAGLYLAGGAGLHRPDLEAWLNKGKGALHSPPLLAGIRNMQ